MKKPMTRQPRHPRKDVCELKSLNVGLKHTTVCSKGLGPVYLSAFVLVSPNIGRLALNLTFGTGGGGVMQFKRRRRELQRQFWISDLWANLCLFLLFLIVLYIYE